VATINDRIGAFLESEGIVHTDARWSFADEPAKYLDPTDYFHSAGIGAMAEVLTSTLVLADPEIARIAIREPGSPENGAR